MKKIIFLLVFLSFGLILCAVLSDYYEIVAIVKICAVIEKEAALNTYEIVLVIILCGFRQKRLSSQTNC